MTSRGWRLVLVGSLGILSVGLTGLLNTSPDRVAADPGVGRILIKSAPSRCRILVDGVMEEGVVTPAMLEASAGQRVVRVNCPGYPSLVKEITVASGEKTRAFFDLGGL
jgi:hypothetical protein